MRFDQLQVTHELGEDEHLVPALPELVERRREGLQLGAGRAFGMHQPRVAAREPQPRQVGQDLQAVLAGLRFRVLQRQSLQVLHRPLPQRLVERRLLRRHLHV